GEHRMHVGHRQRRVAVDALDQCVRMAAAHEGGVPHPRQHDVVDEAAAAAQQRLILQALDAGSDQSRHAPTLWAGGGYFHRHPRPALRWTAPRSPRRLGDPQRGGQSMEAATLNALAARFIETETVPWIETAPGNKMKVIYHDPQTDMLTILSRLDP